MNTDTTGTQAPKGYNGWTNYETWCWKLWMDNEEPSYRYACEIADKALAEVSKGKWVDKVFTREETAANKLADRLKSDGEENMPELDGVWFDMLRAAFSEINWYEIAKSLIEAAKERVA